MELWIVKKCTKMLTETIVDALEHGLIPGMVLSLLVGILIRFFCERKAVKIRRIPLFTSLIYVYLVLWLTIFSRVTGQYDIGISFELYFVHNDWYSILQTVQNILLTLPLGIYTTYFLRRLKVTLSVGVLFSLAVECTQLITGRGTFEISDVIMNIVGALIGGVFYNIVSKLLKSMKKHCLKRRVDK